jgi:hypothetical protein
MKAQEQASWTEDCAKSRSLQRSSVGSGLPLGVGAAGIGVTPSYHAGDECGKPGIKNLGAPFVFGRGRGRQTLAGNRLASAASDYKFLPQIWGRVIGDLEPLRG